MSADASIPLPEPWSVSMQVVPGSESEFQSPSQNANSNASHLQSLQQPLRPERQRLQILAAERRRRLEEEFIRNLPTPDPQCPCVWSPRVRLMFLICMALAGYLLTETLMQIIWAMFGPRQTIPPSPLDIIPRLSGYCAMHEIWRYLVYGDAIRRSCTCTWIFISIIASYFLVYIIIRCFGEMPYEVHLIVPLFLVPLLHVGFRSWTWQWIKRTLLSGLQYESIAPDADVSTTAAVCLPWSPRHWVALAVELAVANAFVQLRLNGNYEHLLSLRHYN